MNFLSYLFLILLLPSAVLAESPVKDPTELVFIFQKQKDPSQIKAAADKVAELLSEKLSLPVRVSVPTDYAASIQALVSKKADFAYTSSLPFLLARRDGGASILLAEERPDVQGTPRTEYDSVFVVRKESALTDVAAMVKAAKQLRVVFTSPTSTSGYLFAYKRFVDEGLLAPRQDPKSAFERVSFGGSYTQALEEVVSKRADVAAVSYYTVEGPSATTYLPQEKIDQLRILGRTPGVPTHVVTARAGLSDALKARVKEALLAIAAEHPALFTDVYGTARFVSVDEAAHVQKTIDAVEQLGLPIEDLAKG